MSTGCNKETGQAGQLPHPGAQSNKLIQISQILWYDHPEYILIDLSSRMITISNHLSNYVSVFHSGTNKHYLIYQTLMRNSAEESS
jgi:hypothetical protein